MGYLLLPLVVADSASSFYDTKINKNLFPLQIMNGWVRKVQANTIYEWLSIIRHVTWKLVKEASIGWDAVHNGTNGRQHLQISECCFSYSTLYLFC
jgi:hypothetical protein